MPVSVERSISTLVLMKGDGKGRRCRGHPDSSYLLGRRAFVFTNRWWRGAPETEEARGPVPGVKEGRRQAIWKRPALWAPVTVGWPSGVGRSLPNQDGTLLQVSEAETGGLCAKSRGSSRCPTRSLESCQLGSPDTLQAFLTPANPEAGRIVSRHTGKELIQKTFASVSQTSGRHVEKNLTR